MRGIVTDVGGVNRFRGAYGITDREGTGGGGMKLGFGGRGRGTRFGIGGDEVALWAVEVAVEGRDGSGTGSGVGVAVLR